MPFGESRMRAGRKLGPEHIAIKAQAEETIGQRDVGLAVTVLIDECSGREIVVRLARKSAGFFLEARAGVGEELGACRSGEEKIGLSIAVVVAEAGATGAAIVSEGPFLHRIAAVAEDDDLF